MEVTIKLSNDNGQIKEISRKLSINTGNNIIQELEREIGLLNQELNSTIFEESLSAAQTLYSEEKKK